MPKSRSSSVHKLFRPSKTIDLVETIPTVAVSSDFMACTSSYGCGSSFLLETDRGVELFRILVFALGCFVNSEGTR